MLSALEMNTLEAFATILGNVSPTCSTLLCYFHDELTGTLTGCHFRSSGWTIPV